MNIETFQREAEQKMEELRSLITENVKRTGDKKETCQRLTLIAGLNHLERAVNGTTQEDML